ncbi:helix-turn-helix transcriptional regulator [Tsuneonella mangrovi]|uniref:helix-turn-helix transcriptional regulator n=1 Tax=Tsuneonella mangrovi TaxID=1982042 RepID=UPI000BA23CCB|nr:helix-turn-helix domain-containing protein [Tsuneonella mangrovi]
MYWNASLSQEGEQPAARSGAHGLSFIDATKGTPPAAQACRVKAVSENSLLLESKAVLDEGSTIVVALPNGKDVTAKVVWRDGQSHGCEFVVPLSSDAIESLTAETMVMPTVLPQKPATANEDETFGMRLRRLRLARSINQAHLARQLGVSKVTVWNWEKDGSHPRTASLEQLAEIFECSVQELMFGAASPDAGDGLRPNGGLRETLEYYKAKIAEVAGTRPEDVAITISFNG